MIILEPGQRCDSLTGRSCDRSARSDDRPDRESDHQTLVNVCINVFGLLYPVCMFICET
jgi:hypothetical protein